MQISSVRHRANMAHIRQSRPDSGLDFQVKTHKPFKLPPFRSEAVCGLRPARPGRSRLEMTLPPLLGATALHRADVSWKSSSELSGSHLGTLGGLDAARGSMKVTTRLNDISHCKAAPGTNWLNRWRTLGHWGHLMRWAAASIIADLDAVD